MRFRMLRILVTTCSSLLAQPPSCAGVSAEHHSDLEIICHIFKPVELPVPDLSNSHVPDGFRIVASVITTGYAVSCYVLCSAGIYK